MTAALLQTRGLTARFGGVTAVDDVDFSVRPGELRCLIGPNGAGKSSFFKMLSGQLKPSAGSVTFKGVPLAGKSAAQIAQLGIGIKTQVPNVFDGLTVRQSVRLAAERALPPLSAVARVDATLERLRIAELADRKVGQLAHGQRQLVELAMVLAPSPDLLLLDEPAAGMTGDEVLRLGEIIVEMARSSAVVVVEHDMSFIRRIGRTVSVLNRGRLLTEGPVDRVLDDQRVRDVYLGRSAR
ncbi:MAG: ATP-binding cassette domain-containing protein [Burkholderiaceae bacterium]